MPLLNHMKLRRGAAAVRAIYHKRAVLSGPTLDLDFTGQQYIRMDAGEAFGDIITFTRASAATRFNASGVLETVGNNVPRIDYDPVTLACRGLLIEERRTNMLLNSAVLSTQSVAVSGVAKTLTFTGTGSIALSGAHTATLNGTGANNRVALTFTPSAGTLTLTVTGDVRNAQLEVGAFATSWIPTTGAQATRAADVSIVGAVAPWFSALTGTMFADCIVDVPAVVNSGAFGIIGDSGSNRTYFYRNTEVTHMSSNKGSGSTIHLGSWVGGAPLKLALAWAGESPSETTVANNGVISFAGNQTLDWRIAGLRFGARLGPVTQGRMWVRKLRYFPKRLTNAELQALTA